MSRIAVAATTADLTNQLLRAMDGGCRALLPGPLPVSPAAFFAQLDVSAAPEVIVLDAGADPRPALDLASLFDHQCPSIRVVLVSDQGPQIGLEAMRAGVRDIIHPAMDGSEIRAVLERASEAARALESEVLVAVAPSAVPLGRVISVVSPKGGVGKTTVATNLAVGLAQYARATRRCSSTSTSSSATSDRP